MELVRNYENITVETLLKLVPGKNPDMYEDDAEELLEEIDKADAMHPAYLYRSCTVAGTEGDRIILDGKSLACPLLADLVKAGDRVYPVVIMVGNELSDHVAGIDDVLQGYLGQTLMNVCMEDGLAMAADKAAMAEQKHRVMMAVPGIEEKCPLETRDAVLELLSDRLGEIGVAVSETGSLRPIYTMAVLLYPTEGDPNLCADFTDAVERKKFVRDLYVIAGHV